jgi:hypothetical protein
MANIHSQHIEKLKIDFDNIITLKQEMVKIKIGITEKLAQLKTVYNELLQSNSKKIFLFCLDSFYFQYKIFTMEMEYIDRNRILLNNRMYCDYYKLYNIIITIVKEKERDNVSNDTMADEEMLSRTYPVYKDLEPFQEYKLEDIKDLHSTILAILNTLYLQYMRKQEQIDNHNDSHRVGFSISNFINTLNYENRLMNEQITLHINYMSFFHISQKRHLTRLYAKMADFLKEIEENININRTFSINDIIEQQRVNRFFIMDEEIQIDYILEDSELMGEPINDNNK